MDFLSSNSFMLLEKSLGFLWTKEAAIADNVANAETPNYKAKTVTFEESLRSKIARAGQSAYPRKAVRSVLETADFAVIEEEDSTRMDDNGVNVTEQMTEAVRTAYQMRYVMNAITSDISSLQAAIRSSQ